VSDFPAELKYAHSPEWARLESDRTVGVGITDHAQDALGDIVFIELPEIGAEVAAGFPAGPPTAPKVFLTIAGVLVFTAFQR
jgi:glycine cleavage system H protein